MTMEHWIEKPVRMSALFETVREHLEKEMPALRDAVSAAHALKLSHLDTAAALARIGDCDDLYGKMLELFTEHMPSPETIVQQFRAGDVEHSQREAHSVKGMSAQIGAEMLRGIAAQFESAIKAGDLQAVEATAALLAIELKIVLAAIGGYLRRSKAAVAR